MLSAIRCRYYTLALAYSNSGKLSNAVTEFGYTHSILKANINAMRDNPKSKVEMEGLEEVAAEVREKIVDLKAEIQSKESSQATPVALPNAEVTPAPSRPAVYSGKGKGKARVDPVRPPLHPRNLSRTMWAYLHTCVPSDGRSRWHYIYWVWLHSGGREQWVC